MTRPMHRAERERKARIRRYRRENVEIVPVRMLKGTRFTGRYHHVLRLKIDHQSFTFDMPRPTTKREARWFATNPAIALHRFKHGD